MLRYKVEVKRLSRRWFLITISCTLAVSSLSLLPWCADLATFWNLAQTPHSTIRAKTVIKQRRPGFSSHATLQHRYLHHQCLGTECPFTVNRGVNLGPVLSSSRSWISMIPVGSFQPRTFYDSVLQISVRAERTGIWQHSIYTWRKKISFALNSVHPMIFPTLNMSVYHSNPNHFLNGLGQAQKFQRQAVMDF